jgi:hypothetical protein
MAKHVSPAGTDRARRLDQALDVDRQGRDRNRNAARQLPPSHGDPPRGRALPNTGNGRVGR